MGRGWDANVPVSYIVCVTVYEATGEDGVSLLPWLFPGYEAWTNGREDTYTTLIPASSRNSKSSLNPG